jgi:DNA mismatch repair protein MutH
LLIPTFKDYNIGHLPLGWQLNMNNPAPPGSEAELLSRAYQLAGLPLKELALQAGIVMPDNLKREKGWVGLLLEHILGATAGSKALPDFPQLGIELKTLPINSQGKPLETTFVCVAPLTGLTGINWHNCHLRHKLAKVLWVPILAEKDIPLGERQVCSPFLWTPDAEEEALMAADWQELTDMIVLGRVEQITARHGQVLQLRPKGANSKAKTKAFDYQGRPFETLPRGFYLKTDFTHKLLLRHLRIA